jgi:sugar/nucleoside kinase (ribokinase family)
MQIDVLCIGHAAYDVSVFVDGYPRENSKCETHELLEACGGPAANAAFLLSSWGLRCGFAGLVGDDVYGRRIRDEFQSVGSDVSLLELRKGHVTPLSVILINKRNGSRTIVNRKSRSLTFRCRDFGAWSKDSAWESRAAPRILLFDGHEPEASLAALAAFPDAISILDAGSWRDGTAALAGKVRFLAASQRFALQATNLADLHHDESRRECLTRLRGMFERDTVLPAGSHTPAGCRCHIVTLGENGLIFDDGSGFQDMPAFPVETVDTTAAGDIWHGAFAFGIAEAMPLRDALRFASMAAALSVETRGGRASMPTLHRVKEALAHAG